MFVFYHALHEHFAVSYRTPSGKHEEPTGNSFLSANRQAFRISLSIYPWRYFPVGQLTGTITLTVFGNFL
jgi:hypothetical protein